MQPSRFGEFLAAHENRTEIPDGLRRSGLVLACTAFLSFGSFLQRRPRIKYFLAEFFLPRAGAGDKETCVHRGVFGFVRRDGPRQDHLEPRLLAAYCEDSARGWKWSA